MLGVLNNLEKLHSTNDCENYYQVVYHEEVDDFRCYALFLYWNSRNEILAAASRLIGTIDVVIVVIINTFNAIIVVKFAKKLAKKVILLHSFHLMSRIVKATTPVE